MSRKMVDEEIEKALAFVREEGMIDRDFFSEVINTHQRFKTLMEPQPLSDDLMLGAILGMFFAQGAVEQSLTVAHRTDPNMFPMTPQNLEVLHRTVLVTVAWMQSIREQATGAAELESLIGHLEFDLSEGEPSGE